MGDNDFYLKNINRVNLVFELRFVSLYCLNNIKLGISFKRRVVFTTKSMKAINLCQSRELHEGKYLCWRCKSLKYCY